MVDRINAETRLGGLIATPAKHSSSPKIYNAAFAKLGINYSYMAFDVPAEEFANAIQAIRTLDMFGANISMPYKPLAVEYMDSLSPAAELIGAVNTVLHKDGKLIGHNTDGVGFVANLREHGVEVKGRKMVLVGVGGAGAAVATQCVLDGAASLTMFNKKDAFFPTAQKLADRLAAKAGVPVKLVDLDDKAAMEAEMAGCDLFANATSVGMMGKLEDLSVVENADWFRPGMVVADTVYHPAKTKMLAMAESKGCQIVNGEGMLLGQANANFEIYVGQGLPLEYIRQVMAE